ncbi:MAG TPA: hypothetical protein DDX75_11530 [Phycisphaerales bacterium]|nr:hypothetical protein [Phycisphaerales bacterium]
MNKAKKYILVIAVVVVMAALIVDICLQFKAIDLLEHSQVQCPPHKSLPCESVPLRWSVDNYDCANSLLLLAMNVTNVKFYPPTVAK